MAEEFQAAEVWWTSPRATLNGCWQNYELIMNMKTASRSTEGVSPDSTFQTTTNWNQAALLVNATSEDQSYMNQIEMIPANTSCFSMNQEQTSYGYPSSLLQQPLIYDNLDRVSSSTLHLANKTPFWNASAVDLNDNRASSHPRFVPSSYEERPNRPNIKSQNKEMGKKSSGDQPTTFKRPRLETPSPLPTFKVRKEKLGDRVTALQQLVSPFGKTDTASVLHETIEYIKLLHDQVNVLSTPYMKNGANMQMNDKLKDNQEGVQQQDLKSRGLCLVPVSTTFPVAAPEYWTSSFGSTF